MSKRMAVIVASFALVMAVSAAGWWLSHAFDPTADIEAAELPVPPFPPRITEGTDYEACLASLGDDPAEAVTMAETLQANGSGDGGAHCHGLALIALGKPADGAAMLESLAQRSSAPPLARASVLAQAGQARLMVQQPAQAVADASLALTLSPADTELFIMRASAETMQGRLQAAIDDLSTALRLDTDRPDALVARAIAHRELNQLDLAQADVARALSLDPEDPDALLERGILRQRMGDRAGARVDWEHARGVDPNSTTADLAEQNLSLLEAGPERK